MYDYQINPELDNMADFGRLVRQANRHGLAVITFENIGYYSVDAPIRLKAYEDVRAGKQTKEIRRFV